MCGGLASALGLHTPQHNFVFIYHLGRLTSYCFAGLLVGLIGFWFAEFLGLLNVLRIASALMLILMGLYLAGWFNGLIFSEKLGAKLWRHLQPLGKRFMRPQNFGQAFLLGAVWGWLPCGLVYSGLIYASTQANWLASPLTMLAFGAGTLPSMLSASFAGSTLSQWLNAPLFRKASGTTLCAYGVWTLVQLVS